MPRGRKANPDKRIQDLIAQLKAALVAREQSRIESQVSSQVDALFQGLGRVTASSNGKVARQTSGKLPTAGASKKERRSWNPAAREAARKRMVEYWRKKRAKTAK